MIMNNLSLKFCLFLIIILCLSLPLQTRLISRSFLENNEQETLKFEEEKRELEIFLKKIHLNRRDLSDESQLVRNLPGAPKYKGRHWTGFVTVQNNYKTANPKGNLFYWYFEANTTQDVPIIIWLNGGPGCSSFDGLLLEYISPFVMNKYDPTGSSLSINPHTWANFAHLVFVDQPIGTGLSYAYSTTSYAETLDQAGDMFYQFVVNFLDRHPNLKSKDIYIFGESFAGHYIPVFAKMLISQNNPDVKVKGVGIGNGWVNPKVHYTSYIDFSYANGIIMDSKKSQLQSTLTRCYSEISYWETNGHGTMSNCNSILNDIMSSSGIGPKVNCYDIRRYDTSMQFIFNLFLIYLRFNGLS
eukprot:TRINITY_DN1663_c0_g2_i1.p1 TRINITY_DN1663_c0_g2~~TRINITY_DN1663_c0_g2_i1.p1  ORF type:complete len:357 (+),score=128.38 TRINITY_DN1663_c0_g2_i1:65-1135(+)